MHDFMSNGSMMWRMGLGSWIALLILVLVIAALVKYLEWLNIVVRAGWAYSDLMPVVPIINTGLAPLLQWILIPLLALSLARKAAYACQQSPACRQGPGCSGRRWPKSVLMPSSSRAP